MATRADFADKYELKKVMNTKQKIVEKNLGSALKITLNLLEKCTEKFNLNEYNL
jgi:hypothetical protein